MLDRADRLGQLRFEWPIRDELGLTGLSWAARPLLRDFAECKRTDIHGSSSSPVSRISNHSPPSPPPIPEPACYPRTKAALRPSLSPLVSANPQNVSANTKIPLMRNPHGSSTGFVSPFTVLPPLLFPECSTTYHHPAANSRARLLPSNQSGAPPCLSPFGFRQSPKCVSKHKIPLMRNPHGSFDWLRFPKIQICAAPKQHPT
jgi:hypothetical protein